jgi:hypothetical protein
MKYWMPLLLIACIAALLVAGCTSTQNSSAPSSPSSVHLESARDASWGGSKFVYTSGQAVAPAPSYGSVPSAGTDTKIIRTADVTIEISNVTRAADTLAGIAARSGGYVSSASISTGYNDRLTGAVTLRIPANRFEDALSGIKGIGKVTYLSVQSQDVTSEYVDTAAKIAAYKNQIAQYNAILKNATEVKDVLAVQQQIDMVQTELDRATGQMKYLTSRIDDATISVSLQEPEPVGGRSGHDFITAINDGIAGFFGVIDGLIVLVITIIPLLVIGGAAYAGYRYYRKRHPAAAQQKELVKKE